MLICCRFAGIFWKINNLCKAAVCYCLSAFIKGQTIIGSKLVDNSKLMPSCISKIR